MERDGGGGNGKAGENKSRGRQMRRRRAEERARTGAGRWLLVLPSRFEFSATRHDFTWFRRLRTLTPSLTLLPPLLFYIYYFSSLLTLHSHPLPLPSTHALILNPFDILRLVPFFFLSLPHPSPLPVMSTKGRSTPRVVCCAIPIARAAGKVLVITSRKRPNHWVCESLPVARSTPAFSLTQTCFLKCRKAVGSPQMLRSRLLPQEKPGKKVESFVPLPVPPHPDIHFAPCSHCCRSLL
jgi:hypothetical protein